MKANQLRIGNYIQDFEDKPYYFQIESIENNNSDYWVTYRNGSVSCIVDALEPIPLTEEWLVKFGFISNPYADCYDFNGIKLECDKTKGRLELWCANITGKIIYLISVHQLQNLYFALTGEELTIQ
jgi:hypothetical protein